MAWKSLECSNSSRTALSLAPCWLIASPTFRALPLSGEMPAPKDAASCANSPPHLEASETMTLMSRSMFRWPIVFDRNGQAGPTGSTKSCDVAPGTLATSTGPGAEAAAAAEAEAGRERRARAASAAASAAQGTRASTPRLLGRPASAASASGPVRERLLTTPSAGPGAVSWLFSAASPFMKRYLSAVPISPCMKFVYLTEAPWNLGPACAAARPWEQGPSADPDLAAPCSPPAESSQPLPPASSCHSDRTSTTPLPRASPMLFRPPFMAKSSGPPKTLRCVPQKLSVIALPAVGLRSVAFQL
mmetsp:Transcript_42185/g.130723  ORF Transcript_42185/g.130723 Transcript_42185/m.130723 type:complete len:303 (-) Transcript_42185:1044-1952(-)